MSVTSSESNGSTQSNNIVPRSTPKPQNGGGNLKADVVIPKPLITMVVNLLSAGVTPEAVVKELTKQLSKSYDPATAKGMAEKAVYEGLKSPGGAKALFGARIANGKDPQQVKDFIAQFTEQYGADLELMKQLDAYVKNLSYDNFVKMGVVDSSQSDKTAKENIADFLVDSLDEVPGGGIESNEAEVLAEEKMAPQSIKTANAQLTAVALMAINTVAKNGDNLKNAKSELEANLISQGYSAEDAKALADELISNVVLGKSDVVSDKAALIVYNHASGASADKLPTDVQLGANLANQVANNFKLFMSLTGQWTQDSLELKQQLQQETIDSIPGALSFGIGVASDVTYDLLSITAPGPDGGPSKLDAAYEEGVSHWRTLVEGSGTEAVKQMLMNDYGVSAEDANNFIIFLTSSVANETGVIPDSIKQIIDNDGPGGIVLYSKVGMYNTQIETYTETLDSFDKSLRSELEALGVPTEVLDKYTTAELTDPAVQSQIAEESGVNPNWIVATTNGAEVMLRIDVATVEQETYITSLQQEQLENLALFNAGLISKEDYDKRSSDTTTKINEVIQIAENYQTDLRKMLDLFIQIVSMHP